MRLAGLLAGKRLEVGCTVVVDHTPECLGAHVLLDGEPEIGPGDRVRVTGAPIEARPGERLVLRRRAEIVRAGALGRALTRIAGHLRMLELAEVSFTDRRLT